MSDKASSDNVTPLQRAGKQQRGERDLFALLSRIDELEDTLELMDEVGVTTREELDELIGRLESEAAALEESDPTS